MKAGGSYLGDRGLARRGLDAGERWAAYWCSGREGERLRREGEDGCGAAPWSGRAVAAFCEERLLVVDWDHRFMLAAPSRKGPMPSAAPLAALERRLAAAAAGGGVARKDGEGASGWWWSLSEAARLTVTTDDDEMEVPRDEVRRWACECEAEWWCGGRGGACGCWRAASWCGAAAGVLCIFKFMLAGEGLGGARLDGSMARWDRAIGGRVSELGRHHAGGLPVQERARWTAADAVGMRWATLSCTVLCITRGRRDAQGLLDRQRARMGPPNTARRS